MKKLITLSIILCLGYFSQAQIFSFGVKGGINSSEISFDDFSVDGTPQVAVDPADLSQPDFLIDINGQSIINPKYIDVTTPKVSFEPSSYNVGFHFGLFARFKIAALFLQPELIFSHTSSSINLDPDGFEENAEGNLNEVWTSKISYNNFDIPILLGIKLGPAHLCVGPVASFKLTSSIDDETKELLDKIEREEDIDIFTATKNATFGAQVGAGVTIKKKVTIDVRYEFGLSKLGESVTIAGEEFKTDQRQNQFLASIGYVFGKKK